MDEKVDSNTDKKEGQKVYIRAPIIREFEQKGTSHRFTLRSIDSNLSLSDDDYEQIAQICNEEEIYRRLFSYRLQGRPYTPQDATKFINWAKESWEKQERYLFFIYDSEGKISGLIDINSSDNVSRIGYWNSSKNRGVMSNALLVLAMATKEAGYKELYATPNPNNLASQKALTNAGFLKGELVEAWNGHMWPKYFKKL